MKKIIFSLFFLLSIPLLGMDRIHPNSDLMKKFVQFHARTGSSGTPKPNMNEHYKADRRFVAKMDSFGLDRYFQFTTNQHVDELVQGVRQGGGMGLDWYYYEEEEGNQGKLAADIKELAAKEGFSGSITEIAPNVVVISGDQD